MKLSVCICTVFREVDFVERIAKVKEAGLPAFEFWGWSGADLDGVLKAKNESGLALAAICVDSSDAAVKQGLGKGSLVNPEARPAFVAAARETIGVAKRLGCSTIISTVGNDQPGLSPWQMHDSIVNGMKAVAPDAEKAGVTFVIEPLNTLVNHKGYYLWSSREGFDICRAVDSPAVKLLFDIYHQQITEGNLINNIRRYFDLIAHFHIGDAPGRKEPGTGEINYRNVLKAIHDTGYTGILAMEHGLSAGDTEAGVLKCFEEYRRADAW